MESHLEEGARRGGGWGRPRRRIDHDVAEDGEGAAIRHRERLADPLAGKVDAPGEGVAQGLEEGVGWSPLGCVEWVGHRRFDLQKANLLNRSKISLSG